MKYNSIFKTFTTEENQPFILINRSIHFPDDETLPIYGEYFNSSDTAWTVLSYFIYGTIEYWWVLASLNKSSIFYAPQGETIKIIKKEYLDSVIKAIEENL